MLEMNKYKYVNPIMLVSFTFYIIFYVVIEKKEIY